MAKKDKNEDEYKDENLDNSANQDDEDFGLPDLDDDNDSEEPSSSYDEDQKEIEEDRLSDIQEPSDSPYLDDSEEDVNDPYESDPYEEELAYERDEAASAYVPPKKSSAAPIVITLTLIVLLALLAVYFIFIREPESSKETKQAPVKDTTSYVVEKPVVVEEPEIKEPEEPKIGEVNTLSSRTGRSYVVVGSFFDADMAKDYADKLAKDGTSTYIIPPFGKSKFNRVAIEETASFAEANSRATELAGQFKEQPWPLKY
ncbi:SPOR domain-containing protein [Marivirga sp. S37H4]|uniref:SPOR domain-containing protein n=1 Tax=Marivirga aurantiaca TaxID=2802615 RepID=A0A934WWE7_9BACT|nr:SPOR domain-containing protein [Marivirga aurantiaca]MBK6264229.1 SPOR domain-containing protein [Marivirga aurantiaca]